MPKVMDALPIRRLAIRNRRTTRENPFPKNELHVCMKSKKKKLKQKNLRIHAESSSKEPTSQQGPEGLRKCMIPYYISIRKEQIYTHKSTIERRTDIRLSVDLINTYNACFRAISFATMIAMFGM